MAFCLMVGGWIGLCVSCRIWGTVTKDMVQDLFSFLPVETHIVSHINGGQYFGKLQGSLVANRTLVAYRCTWHVLLLYISSMHADEPFPPQAFVSFDTMENSTRSEWCLSQPVGKWRSMTDPHGDFTIKRVLGCDKLYADLLWNWNGQNPKSHTYIAGEIGYWSEFYERRLLMIIPIQTEYCLGTRILLWADMCGQQSMGKARNM